MQEEIEAKFLLVDHDKVRAKLRAIDATLSQPMRLMRRTLFDYPDMRLQKANWGRLRVRDEGNKLTVSYKSGGDGTYSQEVETIVDSYENMQQIFEAIGLQAFVSQESKRETWQWRNVEIMLDEWPHLSPYIEIEGPSEDAIQQCAAELGFAWKDAKFGNVDVAYRYDYPGMKQRETINAMPKLRFSDPLPKWLAERSSA